MAHPLIPPIAFVLGGGGVLGACEAGMLHALLEADVRPDLVVGTSVGAINGSAVAASPTVDAALDLADIWQRITDADLFGGSLLGWALTLVRTRTHIQDVGPLRRLLAAHLPPDARIEDLPVHFECVAASVERASEHWFTSGPLLDAVLASSAIPGVLPMAEIDGEHYLDGGLVNSIPIGRAVALGARTVFVLHVGRLERPLEAPRTPWEVGLVAFEIARRHRFNTDLASLPEHVDVHVLPTGVDSQPRYTDLSNLRYWDTSRIGDRVQRAYEASADYLTDLPAGELS